jgi:aryl-alcohol dehydrogenase-like predicted oxidoreductase
MQYRYLDQHKISPICFGTATFALGKLRPNIDSQRGISCLVHALNSGINFIHSNPNLGTQWAVREALTSQREPPRHLIKIELPLTSDYDLLKRYFLERFNKSKRELGVSHIEGVVYERDKKKSPNPIDTQTTLVNYSMVNRIFDELKHAGETDHLACLVDSPQEMRLAIDSENFDSFASYFNLFDLWPTQFFDEMKFISKGFIGVRPLRHGLLVDNPVVKDRYTENMARQMNTRFLSYLSKIKGSGSLQSLAIRFALAHPIVKTTILCTSDKNHLDELIKSSEQPMRENEFQEVLSELWRRI